MNKYIPIGEAETYVLVLDHAIGRLQSQPGEKFTLAQLRNLRAELRAEPKEVTIDVVLYCPVCGLAHVDRPDEPEACGANGSQGCYIGPNGPNGEDQCKYCGAPPHWDNPPHKTHRCLAKDGGCGHEWRPSAHCTNGVPPALALMPERLELKS